MAAPEADLLCSSLATFASDRVQTFSAGQRSASRTPADRLQPFARLAGDLGRQPDIPEAACRQYCYGIVLLRRTVNL